MTELQLTNNSPPFIFKSLGVFDREKDQFKESEDFPIGTEYTLTAGKFP